MTDELRPKDAAEEVALFRAQVLGPVLCRGTLDHGELAEALRELAAQPVRPPGAVRTRTYAVSTLERWYYRYRAGGLEALRPRPRSDRGHGRALSDDQQALLPLQIKHYICGSGGSRILIISFSYTVRSLIVSRNSSRE